MHQGGRNNNTLLSQSWVFQASIASPPSPPPPSARAQRNLLFKRTICLLVAAVVFVTCAVHFYPTTTQILIASENCATTITNVLKKSERLMAIPFEKRLRMLGESLQKVNETVTIVPINSGMARLMFNLRCSLKALHVEPVLYFAYDLKVRALFSSPPLPSLCSLHFSQPLSFFFLLFCLCMPNKQRRFLHTWLTYWKNHSCSTMTQASTRRSWSTSVKVNTTSR